MLRGLNIPMPFKLDKVNLRPKTKPKEVTKAPPPIKTPLEWLKFGIESKLNKKQGWLRDVLLTHNLLKSDDLNAL